MGDYDTCVQDCLDRGWPTMRCLLQACSAAGGGSSSSCYSWCRDFGGSVRFCCDSCRATVDACGGAQPPPPSDPTACYNACVAGGTPAILCAQQCNYGGASGGGGTNPPPTGGGTTPPPTGGGTNPPVTGGGTNAACFAACLAAGRGTAACNQECYSGSSGLPPATGPGGTSGRPGSGGSGSGGSGGVLGGLDLSKILPAWVKDETGIKAAGRSIGLTAIMGAAAAVFIGLGLWSLVKDTPPGRAATGAADAAGTAARAAVKAQTGV